MALGPAVGAEGGGLMAGVRRPWRATVARADRSAGQSRLESPRTPGRTGAPSLLLRTIGPPVLIVFATNLISPAGFVEFDVGPARDDGSVGQP